MAQCDDVCTDVGGVDQKVARHVMTCDALFVVLRKHSRLTLRVWLGTAFLYLQRQGDVFIHSLHNSFTQSFAHSFINLLIHLFTHWFTDLLNHLCIHSFIHSLTHSPILSLTHSLIYSLIHPFIHSFNHSFTDHMKLDSALKSRRCVVCIHFTRLHILNVFAFLQLLNAACTCHNNNSHTADQPSITSAQGHSISIARVG